MTTVILVIVVVLLIVGAFGDGPGDDGPRAEQLRRDTEDVAIYGAVVRPRLKDERPDDGDGVG